MNELILEQIDYRYILVDSYKSLGLSEHDLATLLVVDNILKKDSVLITAELLALKMNIDVSSLDSILVSLTSRGFIEYETVNNTIKTSIKPTYNKIMDLFKKELVRLEVTKNNRELEEEVSNIFLIVQKELGRTLSPLEAEKIREWISQGIKEEVIINCLHECLAKRKKVTINQLDKQIMKYLSSRDIEKEGYSYVNEKWKKDLEETIKIANVRWSDDED